MYYEFEVLRLLASRLNKRWQEWSREEDPAEKQDLELLLEDLGLQWVVYRDDVEGMEELRHSETLKEIDIKMQVNIRLLLPAREVIRAFPNKHHPDKWWWNF